MDSGNLVIYNYLLTAFPKTAAEFKKEAKIKKPTLPNGIMSFVEMLNLCQKSNATGGNAKRKIENANGPTAKKLKKEESSDEEEEDEDEEDSSEEEEAVKPALNGKKAPVISRLLLRT